MIAAIDYRAQLPARGYRPVYSTGMVCPCCGHRAWSVGRQSAECGRCAAALPLAPGGGHG